MAGRKYKNGIQADSENDEVSTAGEERLEGSQDQE